MQHTRFLLTALLGYSVITATNAIRSLQGSESNHPRQHPLAAISDDLRTRNLNRRILLETSCQSLCKGCIEIEVHFHTIGLSVPASVGANPTELVPPFPSAPFYDFALNEFSTVTAVDFLSTEDYSNSLVRQMEILNEAFSDTPFTFVHGNPTAPIVDNLDWSQCSSIMLE